MTACPLDSQLNVSAGLNAEYVNQVMDGFELEAVCKARRTGDYHLQTGPTSKPQAQLATALMVYRAVLRPWVRKLLALLLASLSAVIVWSEATIGSGRHPDLSPFSLVRPLAGCLTEGDSMHLPCMVLAQRNATAS